MQPISHHVPIRNHVCKVSVRAYGACVSMCVRIFREDPRAGKWLSIDIICSAGHAFKLVSSSFSSHIIVLHL